ncbi:MAG: hypothetical protein M1812_006408 [Candelaria pacifica]|nr:MAG: hypothetical protein M1812_006408 [Candelaria pacifica]
MTSYFSHLNPVPSFPAYTGPYKVGSVDVEISTSDLRSPVTAPDPSISTVHFRIFYPCDTPLKQHERPVRWIPHPQRENMGAYARFLGAGSVFADVISYFPRLLYYITIPVLRNAPLLKAPTRTKRWPVLIFSHGLGGSRNAYSHLLGSLSSHGVVVVAPDHRDGSSPLQHIRETPTSKARTVDYRSYPHKPSKEVEDGRNEQLRIRCWELGLIHEALLKIDLEGATVINLDPNDEGVKKPHSENNLHAMFKDQLDIHRPSSISWAGHSFGASTIVQFVKSVFWQSPPCKSPSTDYKPLFHPSPDSAVIQQITPFSPVVLLDLWCLPLHGDSTRWLWNKPMPCYSPSGPGGTNLLAILSEAFFNWQSNLKDTKHVLSENPSSTHQPRVSKPAPHFFYPVSSAHLSQSDFGVLFPWVTKRVFKAQHPERTLRLNVRAILQMLRDNGVEVGDTSCVDMEDGEVVMNGKGDRATDGGVGKQDWKILKTNGEVKGWVAVDINSNDRKEKAGDETEKIKEKMSMSSEADRFESGNYT